MAIDRDSSEPVHRQIAAGIRTGIRSGALRPGDALPSSRALAACPGVARATIVTSFRELEGEDWLESVTGVGTFVTSRPALSAPASTDAAGRPAQDEVRFDLRTGRVDAALPVAGPGGEPDAGAGRVLRHLVQDPGPRPATTSAPPRHARPGSSRRGCCAVTKSPGTPLGCGASTATGARRAVPHPDRPGLVIGFAQLTPASLRSAVTILRAVPELRRAATRPESAKMVR